MLNANGGTWDVEVVALATTIDHTIVAADDALRYDTAATQDGCENVVETSRLSSTVFRDLDCYEM